MEFERVKLEAVPLLGVAFATEEILTDSIVSFIALLQAGFRDEFNSKLVEERLRGVGGGQFEGVMNSPAKIEISQESGQKADTITYGNLIAMRSRCWGYQNAVWMANQDCLPQLMQIVLPIGTAGVAMWQMNAREGEPDTLLGRPIIYSEHCSTVGDAGDLILVNWSQYLEGTYERSGSAESMHVRFENHERAFKFWMRNAGAGWWKTALTPKRGASLSPFIMLAERT